MRPLRNDPATVERIVREHWDFAIRRAWWHCRRCCPDGDRAAIESDALLGLFDAARTFDPSRGVELTTHIRALIDFEVVDGYRQRLGRTSKRSGRPGIRRTQSLEEDLVERGEPELGFDAVEDDTDELLAAIWAHFQMLTMTERAVMVAMYAEGMSQTQVATARGVTVSAVCITHRRAVGKLRRRLVERVRCDHLGSR